MKKYLFFLFLIVSGCSPQLNTYYDYDRDVNLSAYATYQWQMPEKQEYRENPLYQNELNDKRIKALVNSVLMGKGYAISDNNPELKIHYHVIVEDKTVVQYEPYGYEYSPYWLRREMNSYQYKEGTLIIDVMDVKTNALAWRGWAVVIIEDVRPKDIENRLNKIISKILEDFPASVVDKETKTEKNDWSSHPGSN